MEGRIGGDSQLLLHLDEAGPNLYGFLVETFGLGRKK